MKKLVLGLFAFILVLCSIILMPYVADSLFLLSIDYYPLCGY
jgi:hypothetical protein